MARYGMVINLEQCFGCKSCMAACSVENQTPFWSDQEKREWRLKIDSIEIGKYPSAVRLFTQNRCQHCEEPACEMVCPTSSTYVDSNGTVLVNYDECIGCMACMDACPYDARYFYSPEDVKLAVDYFGKDFVSHLVPHVDKCDFCQHRLEEGLEPACASTCIGDAITFVDLDDKANKHVKMIESGKAKPLHPEFGMAPKVFYVGLPEKHWNI